LLLTVYCYFPVISPVHVKKFRRGQGRACVRRRGAPVPRHNGTMASPSLSCTCCCMMQLKRRYWTCWQNKIKITQYVATANHETSENPFQICTKVIVLLTGLWTCEYMLVLFVTGWMPRSGKLPVLFLLTGQKSGFSPHRGDTLHRFRSNFAGPTVTWVRIAVQNFTSIAQGGWECGPKNIKNFHFLVNSRPVGATPLTDFQNF